MTVTPRNALIDRAGRPDPTPVLFLGENARTADQEALEQARTLAAAGVDPGEVWRSTGWFQGPDRGWRFEIDDRGFDLTPDAQRDVTDGTPIRNRPLSEVYEHPDLFAGYPEMRNLNTSVEPQRLFRGLYQPGEGVSIEPEHARRTGAHEIQHGIDHQMAGFGYGLTPNAIGERGDIVDVARDHLMDDPVLAAMDRRWRILAARMQRLPAGEERDQIEPVVTRLPGAIEARAENVLYQRQTGEEMARAVERRLHLAPEERRARPPWLDFTVPPRNHLIDPIPPFDQRGRPFFAE